MNPSNPAFLETADRIGRRLGRDAVWARNQCNWLGWSMERTSGGWGPGYRSFGADFYSGTAGIAFFLGQLYRLTRDAKHRRTLEGALNQALQEGQFFAAPLRAGFYAGPAGLGHV
ncbi:MAG TPA: hypothetical protein VHH73_08880, partial [Verrucomicrobiae bacterium]|nr:hypothetical protein [Verrucomicrobiae bacterium]